MDNKYLKDVYRSRKTMVEMLTDRGYDMTNIIYDMSFDTFCEMSNYDIVDANDTIYLYYVPDNIKLSSDIINNIINEIIEKYGSDIKIIMIYTNIVSSLLLKHIPNVQLFDLCEVIVNKTKHKYYSLKHVIIDDVELQQLLKKYVINKNQLPKILNDDPMAKILNAKIGDVLKIERKSKTTGIYYYYRVCV
jgi:DNA-directed RNA polymerase subunit H (RpoH/RPB5)